MVWSYLQICAFRFKITISHHRGLFAPPAEVVTGEEQLMSSKKRVSIPGKRTRALPGARAVVRPSGGTHRSNGIGAAAVPRHGCLP